jgi:pimeloyl-ACP methyl ester carboxylesterase
VEKDVQLEVLDWGGSGRPLVLLAGQGLTAHAFDDFALKLATDYHVYGITRRGFGASSTPEQGYSADRLGDDVLAALDALKLDHPVLVGHSIAGQELSSVGTRHPERISGLIYLDAGYGHAYYDTSQGYYPIDQLELKKKLEQMEKLLIENNLAEGNTLANELLQKLLPRFERSLKQEMDMRSAAARMQPAPSAPTAADLESVRAFRTWLSRAQGFTLPEAELRQQFEITDDGRIVGQKPPRLSAQIAIAYGMQKHTDIRVPSLAIFAMPSDLRISENNDQVTRAKIEYSKIVDAIATAFETGNPSARVVRLPNANHVVFQSNEADVLREMKAFLSNLR